MISLQASLNFTDNMTSVLRRTQSRLNDTAGSLNRLGGNQAFSSLKGQVVGLTAALGGAVGAAGLLNATIGEAVRYEGQEILITALFNDEKLSKDYTAMMQRVAEESPVLNSGDMMQASSGLVSLTKDMGELEKAWKVVEKMKIINPMEDENGSLIALKELASGDVVSMSERFNIDKKVLNDLKGLSFDEQLDGLTKYMDGIGLTSEAVDKYGDSTIAKWNAIKEKTSGMLRKMGTDGASALGKAFDGVLKGLDSGAFESFIKAADTALGQAVTSMTAWIQTVDWTSVATNAKTALDTVVTTVQTAATFIKTHWDQIVFATKAVVIAFAALKTLSFVVGVFATISSAITMGIQVFKALRTALTIARTAFTVLRISMLLFPGTWLIGAIVALIAIGVALYKNWDTVKAKTAQLWAKFKETSAFRAIQSGMDKVKSAAEKVKGAFESVKDGISRAMQSARIAVTDSINSIIGQINNLINMINKIPGVNVPLIATVEYRATGSVDNQTASVKNSGSAGTNSVNGPHALGNHGGWNEIRSDGTLRNLHAGERVLTAVENKGYKELMSSGLPGAIAKLATSRNNNGGGTDIMPVVAAIKSLSPRTLDNMHGASTAKPQPITFGKMTFDAVITAINKVAKRPIELPKDNRMNSALESLSDTLSLNLSDSETQALASTTENSSFSETVSNINTTNTIARTSSVDTSKRVDVGNITVNATVREEADATKIADVIASEILARV